MATPTKSEGTTAGERFLAQLCRNSFLSLWNHSNPFSDDGKDFTKPSSVGRELCDQLVVFGQHVIIFSDKEIRYTDHPNPEVNWARYYKAAIWKSAGQVFQAEKWLREHPDRLYQDAACTLPLQAILPPPGEMVVHRILVVHGVRQACRNALGGYGSFALDTRVTGDGHYKPGALPVRPFVYGQVNPAKGYTHLFDDVSLPAVLSTLDTISDFVEYLVKKERFLAAPGRQIYASSEVEMLAYYLQALDEDERHNFPVLRPGTVAEFPAGEFHQLLSSPHWAGRQAADEVSYLWDNLIEYVTEHYVADTMFFSSDKSLVANEGALRLLAEENRVERRVLAEKLTELVADTPPGQYRVSVLFSESRPRRCFAVTTVPPSENGIEDEAYRTRRRTHLENYCRSVKLRFDGQLDDIVGIATEAGGIQSVDVLHYDCRGGWDAEERAHAEQLMAKAGLMLNPVVSRLQASEYPGE